MKLLQKIMMLLSCILFLTGCLTTDFSMPYVEPPLEVSDQRLTEMLEDIIGFSELLSMGALEGLQMEVTMDEDQNLICTITASGYVSLVTGNHYEGSQVTTMIIDSDASIIESIESMISMLVDAETELDIDYRYSPSDDTCFVTNCFVNGQRHDTRFVIETITLR